jgi:hypothetical protein
MRISVDTGKVFEKNQHAFMIKALIKLGIEGRARCWWLIPIILGTQEAEIKRIMVQSQPGQIIHKALSRKKPSQKQGW